MTRKPWWVYDPKTKQIDWTCGIKDPIECAHYLWEHYDPGTPVDLKYAIEYVRATGDRKLFDAVEGWVKGDGRPIDVLTGQPVGTPESVKAPLYDLLHEQKKPGDKNCPSSYKMGHQSGLNIGGSGSVV
ncbi:hypothetical protein SAMN04490248_111108 [Salinihabitans flavidus]|uniref:Uncharacterized protein n=1 Tax=Salinihabitans flavidus TaxID=569882 RepID=A0A1H8SDH6_9RHOB|nr:hypothetical protein [Salinihabitans flavidus]SEO76338.1 hypothetical protein SAMN04490248_111108 [Salinihabitans flavidus]